jgi:hypothetical protein
MSDYFLNKIYESLLKKDLQTKSNYKTLAESYKVVYEQDVQPTEQPQATPSLNQPQAQPQQPQAPQNLTSFDKIIAERNLPRPNGNYDLSKSFRVTDPQDLKIYQELYTITPETVGGRAQTKGSGNGETSLYWLFSKTHKVQDGRGEDNPDLFINGKGVEVKAYTAETKKDGLKSPNAIKVGKFTKDTENREILSTIFGVSALFKNILGDDFTKTPTVDNWNSSYLIESFKLFLALYGSDLKTIDNSFIRDLYLKLETAIKSLQSFGDISTPEDSAATLIKKVILTKLERKPGDGNYIANTLQNGQVDIYLVDFNKIKNADSTIILPQKREPGVRASASEIIIPSRLLVHL